MSDFWNKLVLCLLLITGVYSAIVAMHPEGSQWASLVTGICLTGVVIGLYNHGGTEG